MMADSLNQSISTFGTPRRTEVLVAIAVLETTYAAELARLLGATLYTVQQIVWALEREGVLAIRNVGRTRLIELNPRFFAYRELKDLALKLADAMPSIRAAAATLRRRPRRTGKKL